MTEKIFGHDWTDIQRAQQRGKLNKSITSLEAGKDYGADPVGDGTFRMVPSGDIVDYAERCKRLSR
jgi:hypothetical protein